MKALLLIAAGLMATALQPAIAAPAAAAPVVATNESVEPQAVSCISVRNARQLQAMRNNLSAAYCLANDIDAGSIENFIPIGDESGPFTGKLFGNGRIIRNLTISSDAPYVGLFGQVEYAVIQDVGLVNVDVSGTAFAAQIGGLAGHVIGSRFRTAEIRRVYVTGRISAVGSSQVVGGIAGFAVEFSLTDSWAASEVSAPGASRAGGLFGFVKAALLSRVYATGAVECASVGCEVGGLVGSGSNLTIERSYASGPVVGADRSPAGGLIGFALVPIAIRFSHALGPVTTGSGNATAGSAGGIAGELSGLGYDPREIYAAGRVTGGPGAAVGGLFGKGGIVQDVPVFWDIRTSRQATGPGGLGYTTSQLRRAVPPDFGSAWAITGNRSYPFLNEPDFAFIAPLATLVGRKRIFIFLPISQHDDAQYGRSTAGTGAASLAAVYTMIARAIGITRNLAKLKDVKIDKYFWNDVTRAASWQGPVTTRATLGTFAPIAPDATLDDSNVIGEMNNNALVILRGRYTAAGGASAEHWLLGTLYMKQGRKVSAIVANDPWTGKQVTIDPATKKVVSPENFPLQNFTIDGYQPVTMN